MLPGSQAALYAIPMHPRELRIQDYTYVLPDERIAAFPLPERDASRLLVYRDGQMEESHYRDIAKYLPEGCTMVFNESKVVEARLIFQKPTGGQIEVFALEPAAVYPDIQTAMSQQGSVRWQCLIGGASKWKHGMILEKKIPGNPEIMLHAAIREREPDSFQVEFSWEPALLHFAEVLHLAGQMPLPPYIKREATSEDRERYQTIFAKEEGSVAAPTAGLHFTPRIFSDLHARKIDTEFVTLHVGAGTFRPVKSDRMEAHEMHAEFIDVTAETIRNLAFAKNIYAVGTTSLRTLETLYWMGRKAAIQNRGLLPAGNAEVPGHELDKNPVNSGSLSDISSLEIGQWDVYGSLAEGKMGREESLGELLSWMHDRNMKRLICKTQILVAPGYRFRMISGLVTNFHQPQSTLLLLVAALIGDDWKKLYQYALDNGFRFLSYGDGCLLSVQHLDQA